MLTHYHGQVFNSSEIGSALGISDTTARRYLDILSGTFMIRQLTPWLENIGKRQVKSPKIFFRDAGLYHALLDIRTREDLIMNPKVGASWEGFALEQIIQTEAPDNENIFFWGIHQQAELDLLIMRDGKRFGFEIKHTSQATMTASMRRALEILKLDHLTIIFRGEGQFPLAEKVTARALVANQT